MIGDHPQIGRSELTVNYLFIEMFTDLEHQFNGLKIGEPKAPSVQGQKNKISARETFVKNRRKQQLQSQFNKRRMENMEKNFEQLASIFQNYESQARRKTCQPNFQYSLQGTKVEYKEVQKSRNNRFQLSQQGQNLKTSNLSNNENLQENEPSYMKATEQSIRRSISPLNQKQSDLFYHTFNKSQSKFQNASQAKVQNSFCNDKFRTENNDLSQGKSIKESSQQQLSQAPKNKKIQDPQKLFFDPVKLRNLKIETSLTPKKQNKEKSVSPIKNVKKNQEPSQQSYKIKLKSENDKTPLKIQQKKDQYSQRQNNITIKEIQVVKYTEEDDSFYEDKENIDCSNIIKTKDVESQVKGKFFEVMQDKMERVINKGQENLNQSQEKQEMFERVIKERQEEREKKILQEIEIKNDLINNRLKYDYSSSSQEEEKDSLLRYLNPYY